MSEDKRFHDEEYLKLLLYVRDYGVKKSDRTGTGTYSVPFHQMRFDISDGSIPLLTTKKIYTKAVIHEILWYLKAGDDVRYLNEHNVNYWNDFADENGYLGPIYGVQWRKWATYEKIGVLNDGTIMWESGEPIDQVAEAVDKLRNNPNDRRIIVNAWNVAQLEDMALPPCHMTFQFWFDGSSGISMHLYQRSCDFFLGVPFNIVQYSILLHMFAQVTGLRPLEFVWTGGDIHLYRDHLEQADTQIQRQAFPSPKLKLNPEIEEIDDFTYGDFEIVDYQYHPTIKAPLSI